MTEITELNETLEIIEINYGHRNKKLQLWKKRIQSAEAM